ncbi:Chromate transport protein ChrA [Acidisarcina polymorpha]|uniref:Chromate transport protein ChrA n=1 Tax=Acidisarcina polymorpha TaxID=2211140 RepID=A0A2Z5FYF3_9BACT|nr:chromate efflux transporter [Acidisarcina polymorpha]AXC11891.1 Chromate transport protein ChrA [Acidisarcina polymorpha]
MCDGLVNGPTFAEALRFWSRLVWTSFGGTAAHIAIMHDDLVEQKKWISNEDFLHALSHCMLLPGPEAQQLAIYIGWKLHGKRGGIAAGSLFVLPSMLVLLALSIVYVRYGHLPWIAAMFGGLKPAVVSLVMLALFRVAKRALVRTLQWVVTGSAFVALAWFHAPLPLVMVAAIGLGLLVGWRRPSWLIAENSVLRTQERSGRIPLEVRNMIGSALVAVGSGFVLWMVPLMLLSLLRRDFSFWKLLSLFFTRTAFVTIGGSYTVLPYVARLAVTKFHWLNHAQMLDGFALAETTPGPLIIVVAFVGFMAGFNHFHGSIWMGTVALLVTTFYTFLPCFVFVFAGAPLIEQTHGTRTVEAALKLITAVVVAAITELTLFLGKGVLFPHLQSGLSGLDWISLLWILLSLACLNFVGLKVGGLIILSLAMGLLRWAASML